MDGLKNDNSYVVMSGGLFLIFATKTKFDSMFRLLPQNLQIHSIIPCFHHPSSDLNRIRMSIQAPHRIKDSEHCDVTHIRCVNSR